MKFFKLSLSVIALAFFAFACGQNATNSNTIAVNNNGTSINYEQSNANANQTATPNDLRAASKKIFSEKCVKCHKETGEGGEVDFDGQKFRVPSLKGEKVMARDDKAYTRVIEEGDDEMPAFKKELKPEEIAGLIKYIRIDIQGK
jgi:mono/diheme cytochrome c family protein